MLLAVLGVTPAQPQADASGRASTALPNLGDSSDLAPGAERKIGDRIARSLFRDPDYIDDPIISEYVDSIWQPLLAASRARGDLPEQLDQAYAWQILIGRDRSVNAFALPGGYFGLHLGLIGLVTSRDELASVLGHEMSHVTQRHISRNMARQGAMQPWLLGAMVMGMLAAAKSPDGASAVIAGSQAAAVQAQLNYSRDMEREADRIGFGVMSQAGFAPQGFVSMFEKLQQSVGLNDTGGYPYLRTHPLTTERIADMQARVRQSPRAAVVPVTTLEHAMVAARARVLSSGGVDTLRAMEQQASSAPKDPAQNVGVLYGASLAAIKLADFALAQTVWERLNAQVGADPAAQRLTRLLAAELALARGDVAAASVSMQGLENSGRAGVLLGAQVALAGARPDPAAQNLLGWLADHGRDAPAWQLLARARAAQGRDIAAIRAQGEADLAQLDYTAALARFRAAQDVSRKPGADLIDASIVDTRARQTELLVREDAVQR